MKSGKYDALRIENQLCFPLYVCSKEFIRRYRPCLDEIDLTYTQYIAMLILWERRTTTVKELGECLYLDSGTLTPMLKKLEQKGLVSRKRSHEDERSLIVSVTEAGNALRDRALQIPEKMSKTVNLEQEEAQELNRLLQKLLVKEED